MKTFLAFHLLETYTGLQSRGEPCKFIRLSTLGGIIMSEPYIGEIKMFGFNWPPRSWGLCNGNLVAIQSNTALFSLLGTTWGGDGRTTFGLPDLRGRMPLGQGTGINLMYRPFGFRGGMEEIHLSYNELPAHTHGATFVPAGQGGTTTVLASTTEGSHPVPQEGDYLAAGAYDGDGVNMYTPAATAGTTVQLGGVISGGGSSGGTVSVDTAGKSSSVPLMNPYLVMNFSIALLGFFPSRND